MAIELLLSPILYPMALLFNFYAGILDSTGAAILLLAVTFSIITLPVQRYGRQIEDAIAQKISSVWRQIQEIDPALKGEERFNAQEAIYKQHHYHPVQSIFSGASFIFQLPFLLAALFLFINDDLLQSRGFYWLKDLSKPDGLLEAGGININLLPVLMLIVTSADAYVFYRNDRHQLRRFAILSIVLFILIYPMPAGLVIYWLTLNLFSSLFRFKLQKTTFFRCK